MAAAGLRDRLHRIFDEWSTGPLSSYLIDITRDILGFRDEDGTPLLERILDVAGQKGTGKWTGISALELGAPVSVIAEAVFARCLSARKDERERASGLLEGPGRRLQGGPEQLVDDVRDALYCAKRDGRDRLVLAS